ncbi:uncharacterized protein BXZ73DRAFT_83412 [Epithele typhae]|uniref:uncharacterized protein n=1 Tax=Epithele typhae TaxID=378194 RepID=UPI0020083C02|nr:uncharacterized protein BXZ73DRAFT_83412 [Epithele typhae]KAH9910592.1 hypothetical protein BXZ73DRAFT_83412 [Epithele typhae]
MARSSMGIGRKPCATTLARSGRAFVKAVALCLPHGAKLASTSGPTTPTRELRYCADQWKAHAIATLTYPNWRKRGNIDSDDEDSDDGQETSREASRKRRASQPKPTRSAKLGRQKMSTPANLTDTQAINLARAPDPAPRSPFVIRSALGANIFESCISMSMPPSPYMSATSIPDALFNGASNVPDVTKTTSGPHGSSSSATQAPSTATHVTSSASVCQTTLASASAPISGALSDGTPETHQVSPPPTPPGPPLHAVPPNLPSITPTGAAPAGLTLPTPAPPAGGEQSITHSPASSESPPPPSSLLGDAPAPPSPAASTPRGVASMPLPPTFGVLHPSLQFLITATQAVTYVARFSILVPELSRKVMVLVTVAERRSAEVGRVGDERKGGIGLEDALDLGEAHGSGETGRRGDGEEPGGNRLARRSSTTSTMTGSPASSTVNSKKKVKAPAPLVIEDHLITARYNTGILLGSALCAREWLSKNLGGSKEAFDSHWKSVKTSSEIKKKRQPALK